MYIVSGCDVYRNSTVFDRQEEQMRKIGLIELPALKLVDSDGKNWTAFRHREPLVSKQVLIPQLLAGGFDIQLFDLRRGEDETEFGTVIWNGRTLSKVLVGRSFKELDACGMDLDCWGITVNYMQEREPACTLIRQLSKEGPVVVGGSDAIGNPKSYLEAGAVAVVMDKSGAANHAVLDYALGNPLSEPLTGVLLADGRHFASRKPLMSPEDWPLPSQSVVQQCMGTQYWEGALPSALLPIGSVFTDIGCDRHCNFCMTPLYKLGYRRMSPERVLKWLKAQKDAGARSVILPADQFLLRILLKGGRDEILRIMNYARELGLIILWGNGLELGKATLGRGLPRGDLTPDQPLVQLLWGWDGENGCYQAYIPAERPVFGREEYAKLLPWEQHCAMLETIVRAGLPKLTYGVIVGLPGDSHETLCKLEEAILELRDRLKKINPELKFVVTPFAIRPLPGTPMAAEIRARGLLRFEDPAILGGFWTACADTLHISYVEVSYWQGRLMAIGDIEPHWQGVTGIIS